MLVLTKRCLGVLADLIGYSPLAFGGHVEVDERGPRAVVAHVLHQFAKARARVGGELVAGMAQVVKVNAGQADSSYGAMCERSK
jgi:hypothetical protein